MTEQKKTGDPAAGKAARCQGWGARKAPHTEYTAGRGGRQ